MAANSGQGIRHGLSFDIEDYYQIIHKDFLGRTLEPTPEVEECTLYLLDMLAEKKARATFFFLGNVARAYPGLVKRAVSDGHEIGVHGDVHHFIHHLNQEEFREEMRRAIGAIEDAGGHPVVGHRAPAFSIMASNLWALDVLAEAGLIYDSSIFPFQGRRYGIPDWSLTPNRLDNGLWEVPLSVVDVAGKRRPAMGGGYFRHFPYAYTRFAARKLAAAGRDGVTYFHPHEFARRPAQMPAEATALPRKGRLKLAISNRLQSRGRPSMRRKLERLVDELPTCAIGDLISDGSRAAAQ